MNTANLKIGVIGAGGWGTALANVLATNGHEIRIWAYEQEVSEEINNFHSNRQFLPGIVISPTIQATNNLNDLQNSDLLLNAIPTQFIRSVFSKYNEFDVRSIPIVSVSKGIEKITLLRVSEIFKQVAIEDYDSYVFLSGPSHAEEVARNMPTAVLATSTNHYLAESIREIFTTNYFRVYSDEDVIGSEIGSALKNVIAIAAGVIDGLGLGDNTKAALITRGLAEISRLGICIGANLKTFSGLSGLGDLFVTCNSKLSRNRYVGEQIGKGRALESIIRETKMVAEGVHTTESAYYLSKKYMVEMPIVEEMYEILFDNKRPSESIADLMSRTTKREWWY